MKNFITVGLVLVSSPGAALNAEAWQSLAELVRVPQGKIIPANSEQRQPLYFRGGTSKITLPAYLKEQAEAQARHFKHLLSAGDEIEAWPVENDHGQRTWTFVRKFSAKGESEWLSQVFVNWTDEKETALENKLGKRLKAKDHFNDIAPEFPNIKDLSIETNHREIFEDFMKSKDLYFKPRFGDSVIFNKEGLVLSAWPHPDTRETFLASPQWKNHSESGAYAVIVKHPPFWVLKTQLGTTNVPFSVRIKWNGKKFDWLSDIAWETPARGSDLQIKITANPIKLDLVVKDFQKNFKDQFMDDVRILAGEKNPAPGVAPFKRKNSADPQNELPRLVAWLEARYSALGIETERHEFTWRGIPQMNLIAKIRGTLPEGSNRPVWMADDNATATAALLQAARSLKALKTPLLHDVWLVHLTGEEFPTDDLGARAIISEVLGRLKSSLKELARARAMQGLLLMDMIGYHKPRDQQFQINSGEGFASERLTRIAWLSMNSQIEEGVIPIQKNAAQIRLRYDQESYLYNTDGLIFSDHGLPVVYFNEHLNRWDGLMRKHYHDTTDVSDFLDGDYASTIAKIAIETAAQMASTR